MQQKSVVNVVLLLVSFECWQLVFSRSYNNGLIFYDLQTLQPYLPPTVSVSRGRGLASVKFSEKGSIWSTFGKPCECRHRVCGCCAGIKVKQYNFDQKMCANVTFVPPKEEALLEVYLNEKPSSKYGISVRNPSPFCIPVMMGIPMAMCVQMSNIAIQGNNLNMCMDFIVRLATTDLFEMHFQCMQMGLDGFQYIDKDGKPVIPPGNSKTEIEDEYYDYETDENEISYGANEQVDKDDRDTAAQQTSNTLDSTYIVGLQQQMQQLQAAQPIKIEKDELVTQINDGTTLAPIVVEAETEIIAAITAAYGTAATKIAEEEEIDATKSTESETEPNIDTVITPETKTDLSSTTGTPLTMITAVENENETEAETASSTTMLPTTTATTINPVNTILNYKAPANNYIEAPSTAASGITSTTEAPIIKPIAAPINVYTMDATVATSENVISAFADAVPLENVTTNYPSNTFNITDSVADIETTTVVEPDLTPAYISAPIAPTAAAANDGTTQNSTAYEPAKTEDETIINDIPAAGTSSTNNIAQNMNEIDNASKGSSYIMPEAPAQAPAVAESSYRHFYGWSQH